ncbi:MAG: hypothetical protein ACI92N_002367 [Pseudomonadales bacterium]|jgi:hypothetical protein
MASVDGGLGRSSGGLLHQQRSAEWGVYWVVGEMLFVIVGRKILNILLIFFPLYL